MDGPIDGVTIRAWKPPIAGIREVLHARFRDHAYPPHTHDVWTLFIVDDGAIRYDLDRHARGAEPAMVSILPPHVVHDGRPGSDGGFRKRVLYLETSLLGEDLIGPAVDLPILAIPGLRREVSALHDALACANDMLEAETRLALVVDRIREQLDPRAAATSVAGTAPKAHDEGTRPELAEALRAFLDGHVFEPVTMAAAGAELAAESTQLARSFSAAFGIPPHAYIDGRRLEAARDRILGGQSLADVAAEVGYADQAHLSRRFKRFLGTTPGRFANARWLPT